MKIIYIANIRLPTEKAHGIQIMQMCGAFANSKLKTQNAKLEVELVVPRRLNPIKQDPFEYYSVDKDFKIIKLPCLDLIPLDKYIGNLGLWIESTTFNFFAFFYLLFKKADIIYTRDKLFLSFGYFKKNFIFEVHTFPKNYFLYSPFIRKLKKIVVITQKLKDLFVEQGIAEDKILVAPDGVDIKMFDVRCSILETREKLNLPPDKKIIGYVGRLETLGKEKGINTLIEAFKILTEKFEDVLLCFVGGPQKRIEEYQEFSKKLEILKKIKFLGQIRYNLIPQVLKSFDVLVMPYPWTNHYAFYMSPLKLFEYMASKRPIVASNLPSIREILNERNAILVEPDNPQALAEGIKKAIENQAMAQEIASRAFQDVQEYTWEKRAKKILELLNSGRSPNTD